MDRVLEVYEWEERESHYTIQKKYLHNNFNYRWLDFRKSEEIEDSREKII